MDQGEIRSSIVYCIQSSPCSLTYTQRHNHIPFPEAGNCLTETIEPPCRFVQPILRLHPASRLDTLISHLTLWPRTDLALAPLSVPFLMSHGGILFQGTEMELTKSC